jgi:hypothetical protein
MGTGYTVTLALWRCGGGYCVRTTPSPLARTATPIAAVRSKARETSDTSSRRFSSGERWYVKSSGEMFKAFRVSRLSVVVGMALVQLHLRRRIPTTTRPNAARTMMVHGENHGGIIRRPVRSAWWLRRSSTISATLIIVPLVWCRTRPRLDHDVSQGCSGRQPRPPQSFAAGCSWFANDLPPVLWRCPRRSTTMLTRDAGPRRPRWWVSGGQLRWVSISAVDLL